MIRIFSYSRESNRMETPPIAELPKHLSDRGRTIWVDLEDPTDEETGVLGGIFGFHILTVEDSIDDAWLPKEDLYDGYSYSIFYAAAPNVQDRLEAQKLDIFVGANYLVTHHKQEIKGIFDTRGVVARVDAGDEGAERRSAELGARRAVEQNQDRRRSRRIPSDRDDSRAVGGHGRTSFEAAREICVEGVGPVRYTGARAIIRAHQHPRRSVGHHHAERRISRSRHGTATGAASHAQK